MNNKAHLRPKDYDSNGDIIPMACKEEKGDTISRKWLTDAIRNRRTCLSYEEAKDVIDLIDNAPTVDISKEVWNKSNELLNKRLSYLERPQGETVIKCKDCKHQKKYWHEDKRMKEKGYWIYGCGRIDDPFTGTPVWGGDNQFCSSAKMKGGAE